MQEQWHFPSWEKVHQKKHDTKFEVMFDFMKKKKLQNVVNADKII